MTNDVHAFELPCSLANKSAEELKSTLLRLIQEGYAKFQIDCSEVSDLETACTQVLIGFIEECNKNQIPVKFINPSPAFILSANQIGLDDYIFDE